MKKQNKQKSDQKVQIHLYQTKQDILFFYYLPEQRKNEISKISSLGKLRLYSNNKLYSSQFTDDLLNPSLNWSQELFQRLLKCFGTFCLFSQKDQYGQFFLQIVVYEKIGNKTICLCKIKMNQEFTSDLTTDLWNQFQTYNTYQSKSLVQKQQQIQVLKQKITLEQIYLQNLQEQSQIQIRLVKGKLSLLLHQKQNKLAELSGNKTKFNYQILKQEIVDHENMEWASSQDDRMLIGSLFQSTQQYR